MKYGDGQLTEESSQKASTVVSHCCDALSCWARARNVSTCTFSPELPRQGRHRQVRLTGGVCQARITRAVLFFADHSHRICFITTSNASANPSAHHVLSQPPRTVSVVQPCEPQRKAHIPAASRATGLRCNPRPTRSDFRASPRCHLPERHAAATKNAAWWFLGLLGMMRLRWSS